MGKPCTHSLSPQSYHPTCCYIQITEPFQQYHSQPSANLSTNMYEGTILHSIRTAGAHPSLSKPWRNSTAIAHPQPKGSSTAIAHPPLWGSIAAIAHPQPRGKLWSHCPSPLTLWSPKLQQWATDPTWAHLGGCSLHPQFGPMGK